VCCGGAPPPASSPHAQAGYHLCHYVNDFAQTLVGSVPVVSDSVSRFDRFGTFLTRLGLNRNHYLVAPGLYAVGNPGGEAPVIVSANYKLSFDAVRFALSGRDAWLLVLDTCGINVWCAAGKGTFSTKELVHRLRISGLEQLVGHRRLIVPQLGATGVDAREVKKQSGFSVRYGPVRAEDIPRYIDADCQADETMRMVTFSIKERAVLIPVEFYLLGKVIFLLLPLLFIISGIGPDIWSFERAYHRGLLMSGSLLAGLVGGLILVPLLLPWLPGRPFALKGMLAGAGCGVLLLLLLDQSVPVLEQIALFLGVVVISSYLGMNFTGSSPFTSPSGVEWEMKKAIPLQVLTGLVVVILWISAPLV
jgi:hypothetical protein